MRLVFPRFTVFVFLFSFSLLKTTAVAQCLPIAPGSHCSPADGTNNELVLASSSNVYFTFDSFSKYKGGITMNGSSVVRVKALCGDGTCKWRLFVTIDNNAYVGDGAPPGEWEPQGAAYGLSGIEPTLDLMEIKVSNGCGTPVFSGTWRTFDEGPPFGSAGPADNGNYLDIIPAGIPLIPAGTCGGANVNGEGSYYANYSEYSFLVDYRIVPGYAYTPGIYGITLKFRVEEAP